MRTHLLTRLLFVGLALPWAGPGLFAAPQSDATGPAALGWTRGAPVEAAGLGASRYASMQMLYERTIFKVDVLRLSLQFDGATAERLERLALGQSLSSSLEGRIADAALEAQDVLVQSRFLRNVTLEQYLDGIRDSLTHARRGGFLSAAEQREIEAGIEVEYAPLRQRGIREGESVWYRVDGNGLHVVIQEANGNHLLDLRFEGTVHRRAILGGYFAPDSDFREALVRSLF